MAQPIYYEGKTAVVTGAGSGIGRALAVALAKRGADLAISDVNAEGLAETARQVGVVSGTNRVKTYQLDVADRAAVIAHAGEVADAFGRVDLVINNAGVAIAATIEDTSFEDLDWLLGVNLYGVINGSKAFLPHLIASGDGHLVNLSSVFGLVAPVMNGAYATAKFGVRGFTECLRQEMIAGRKPVTVHSVHPGGIKTNIARNARRGANEVTTKSGKDPVVEFEKMLRTSPEDAAKAILAGVDGNKARILIGQDAYVIAGVARLLGARYVDLLGKLARRQYRL